MTTCENEQQAAADRSELIMESREPPQAVRQELPLHGPEERVNIWAQVPQDEKAMKASPVALGWFNAQSAV